MKCTLEEIGQKTMELYSSIDMPLLRKQKEILLKMIEDWAECDDEKANEMAGQMGGLVHLIDAIQDHAVGIGMDENDVFKISEE